jgi:hypothetical protein
MKDPRKMAVQAQPGFAFPLSRGIDRETVNTGTPASPERHTHPVRPEEASQKPSRRVVSKDVFLLKDHVHCPTHLVPPPAHCHVRAVQWLLE